MFDYATPKNTSASTSLIDVYIVDSTSTDASKWDYRKITQVGAPNDGAWRGYETLVNSQNATKMMVKLHEAGANDAHGPAIDNFVFREVRENDAVCSGGPVESGLKILGARYFTATASADVSAKIRAACDGRVSCEFAVTNDMMGVDPDYGVQKSLELVYSCPNGEMRRQFSEFSNASLACP